MDISQDKKMIERITKKEDPEKKKPKKKLYQIFDRKSTRLNSSHGYISYAVFCLKKKKETQKIYIHRTETQRIDMVL